MSVASFSAGLVNAASHNSSKTPFCSANLVRLYYGKVKRLCQQEFWFMDDGGLFEVKRNTIHCVYDMLCSIIYVQCTVCYVLCTLYTVYYVLWATLLLT